MELALKVGPEFFQFVSGGIPADLSPPDTDVVSESPRRGMVGVGNEGRYANAEEFGKVELFLTGIRAGDENPAGAASEPSPTTLRSPLSPRARVGIRCAHTRIE